jgi:hypothetical protein
VFGYFEIAFASLKQKASDDKTCPDEVHLNIMI